LLKDASKNFDLIDQGSINKYLGLLIWNNTFEKSQPFLIWCIIDFLSLEECKTKGKETPIGKPLLNQDPNRVTQKHTWLYCSAVRMLSYLSNSIYPEIQKAVPQTAGFSIN
jgi:hypothetical protein